MPEITALQQQVLDQAVAYGHIREAAGNEVSMDEYVAKRDSLWASVDQLVADVDAIGTDPRTRVYVAGPMTGLPNYNREAFFAAERRLVEMGYVVENPAADDPVEGWSHEDYMRRALRRMFACTEVFLLPGWEHSVGANRERALALEFGMTVHYPVTADDD